MRLVLALSYLSPAFALVPSVQLDPRPFWLIEQMDDSPLKDTLREYATLSVSSQYSHNTQ